MFNSFFYVYQAGFLRSLLQRPAPRQIEALLQQYLRKPQEVLCIMTSMMQGNGRKAPGTSWDWTLPCLMNIPLIFHCISADILLVFRCIPLYVCIYIYIYNIYIYIYIHTHTVYTYIPIVPLFLLNHHILEAPQADVCWITTLLVTHCWPRSPVGGWKNCELQVTGEDKGEWNQPYWEENGIYCI